MRKQISEKQIAKLPARALKKIGIGKGGTGSTRFNELILFTFGLGIDPGVNITGRRATISDVPDELRPVLDAFWRTYGGGMGEVDGVDFVLG